MSIGALRIIVVLFLLQLCSLRQMAIAETPRVWFVSKKGNDANSGGLNAPLLTISKAASLALPGDSIIVRGGVYREMITLKAGGMDDQHEISFKAAKGEAAIIKGSERIGKWKKEGRHWRVVVEGRLFKDFTGFIERLNKDSTLLHAGMIFLDNKPMAEVADSIAVDRLPGSWFVKQEEGKITILGNFGQQNPNLSLTEASVRPAAFLSSGKGVNFLSITGFTVAQVANPMASINGEQPGAIAVNGGTHWKIQDCTIVDCSSVGISIGQKGHSYEGANAGRPAFSDLSQDIAAVGHHLIRHNHIYRCGQAAIFGTLQGCCSEIADNLIEDINVRKNYPSKECAGIRLALAVDLIVSHNLIRHVYGGDGVYGIILGPLFQNARISRNIIVDSGGGCLYLFDNHGPVLADNNIFIGSGAAAIKMAGAEANVFVQNLFDNCTIINEKIPGMPVATSSFLPHSLTIKQTIPALAIDSHWFGNLFIKKGLDVIKPETDMESDYNVYLGGGLKSTWGDKNSQVRKADCNFNFLQSEKGIGFAMDQFALTQIPRPVPNADFFGFFALARQFIETPNGKSVTLNRDFFNVSATRTTTSAGPFYRYSGNQRQPLFTF